jgi:Fe2+ or Zn2+ uptake regulation protein
MSIIRAPSQPDNSFPLNKDIPEDECLTWAARGLLIFLLGKSDDWELSVEYLQLQTLKSYKPTKRDGIYALLNELIKAGYIRRSTRGDGSTNWVIFEERMPIEEIKKVSRRLGGWRWEKIRKFIFNRDNYTCVYCGNSSDKLQCDHIIPVSKGGGHDLNNLATACVKCNRDKKALLLTEWKGGMYA